LDGRRGRSHGSVRPRSRTADLKVREPGSHRFGDYWRLGLPLLLFGVVAVLFFRVLAF
jgi:hypothetical protein